jgi:(1->4)-alpha-D-glucan 1-alpha-D-glucosylmutase
MTDVKDVSVIDALLGKARQRARELSTRPESTYRFQFHKGFTFADASRLVGYLKKLGITHAYASPYLKSTAGSTHGYDVIEHGAINPEVGGDEGLNQWVEALRAAGMSHILDIVPNHAGVATNDNPWWNDVLENGPSSRYGKFFDISWNGSPRDDLHGRVLLPLLGNAYAKVLEDGELKLAFDAAGGAFVLTYFQRRFPIAPCSYMRILDHRRDALEQSLRADAGALDEYLSILEAIRHLPDRCDTNPEQIQTRYREKENIKRRLAELYGRSPGARSFIDRNVEIFNGRGGDAGSFDLLDDLLTHQCYRLCYWANASDEINYRRFFDVNDLAALSMQRPEVFEATHELILRLTAQGAVGGLRIDHPDGLFDPAGYLARLQARFIVECAREEVSPDDWPEVSRQLLEKLQLESPRELYVLVEKILAFDEPLLTSWPVHGTTGYDFLNMVNGLFVDPAGEEPFTALYQDFTGDRTPFPELVYEKKKLILETSLSSELHMLAHRLHQIAREHRTSRDFTFNGLRNGLREMIACFPVYRAYISASGATEADRAYIRRAIECATTRNPRIEPSVFEFIQQTLLSRPDFAGRFQQVTSPATAKGVEDTAFYIYHRLISLNEVGGDPDHFGVVPRSLHTYLADRQHHWPYALSALSTHDTKRSEEVRARINVLSEIPDEWRQRVLRWREINRPGDNIDPGEEYLLYQTLVGAWPIEEDRIHAYMLKAMREAKLKTSWTAPNERHESAVKAFISRIITDRDFLDDFKPFHRRVAAFGMINSIAQTLLKIAAPGVPDTYQGTELPDFSLVDPDNRRPVDYEKRSKLLESLDPMSFLDGGMKLHVTVKALNARREQSPLFTQGEYIPLEISGNRSEHVFAFARRHDDRIAMCVVPRLLARLMPAMKLPFAAEVWGETRLTLPKFIPGTLRNIFTDHTLRATEHLPISEVFRSYPAALLLA